MKLEALKLAKKGEMKAEKLMEMMIEFQKSTNLSLQKIAREFYLLIENAKGVLEQHYVFFLPSEDFLNSETSCNRLLECRTAVELHLENIQTLFKELEEKDNK